MKVLRSFPADGPVPGRAYVQDYMPRLLNRGFDYMGLKDYHDDIVLVEWDIAVSRPDLDRFVANAKGDWPIVAPFLARDGSHYMHWREEGDGLRPIRKGEPDCDLFAFGLVYFPAWVIRDYPAGYGGSSILSDGSLPRWLQERERRPVPVDWSVTVVHLA